MLQIKKIHLTNFGAMLGSKVFDFTSGLNIIQAANGSGKSTLVQAIEMLLTNSYEGNFEDYINDKSDHFISHLYFNKDGIDYSIKLSCKKNKNNTLTERIVYNSEDKELASGEDAIEYMANLFDPILTRFSLVAKQKNNIDNIVTCKDAERMELFKKFQDISFEKEITQLLVPYIDNIKQQIVDIEKEIYRLENIKYDIQTIRELPFSTSELIEKTNKVQSIKIHNASIEAKVKEYNTKVEALNKSRESLLQLVSTLESKTTLQQSINNEIDVILLPSHLNEKILAITTQANISLASEENTLKSGIEKLKNSIDTKNIKKTELVKRIEELENLISNIKVMKYGKYDETELKDVENRIATKKQEITYCDTNIVSLEKGICPTCGEKCTHKLEEYITNKKKYSEELDSLQIRLSELKKEQSDFNQLVLDNQKNKDTKQGYFSEKEVKEIELKSIDDAILADENSIITKQQEYDKAVVRIMAEVDKDKEAITATIKKEVDTKKAFLEEVEKDIATYTKSIVIEKQLKSDLQTWIDNNTISETLLDETQLEKDITLYKEIEVSNKLVLAQNILVKKDMELDTAKLAIIKNEKVDLLNKQKTYEQAKSIMLKDFPNYVIESSVEDIEQNMNQFINDVYYKSLNISLRATKTNVKLEYGSGDRKLPAYRLSGAEAKLVSLAFINNFNKYTGLSCLLLDEPDAAMDSKRQEDMYEILLGMKDVYKQMIVITHSIKMLNYMVANAEVNIIQL